MPIYGLVATFNFLGLIKSVLIRFKSKIKGIFIATYWHNYPVHRHDQRVTGYFFILHITFHVIYNMGFLSINTNIFQIVFLAAGQTGIFTNKRFFGKVNVWQGTAILLKRCVITGIIGNHVFLFFSGPYEFLSLAFQKLTFHTHRSGIGHLLNLSHNLK